MFQISIQYFQWFLRFYDAYIQLKQTLTHIVLYDGDHGGCDSHGDGAPLVHRCRVHSLLDSIVDHIHACSPGHLHAAQVVCSQHLLRLLHRCGEGLGCNKYHASQFLVNKWQTISYVFENKLKYHKGVSTCELHVKKI